MKIFHRKSAWERAMKKVPGGAAIKGGALTVAGIVGLSAASAAVSALRDKQAPR
ncbi:hypothetical protein CLV56_1265 [Mumia flava]|uniref:Uncharacterized protein n=1 Tax=Mumia flava TaxID=1348852 RepID=A0A2M9BGH2_9ACTN|nr:hypothetical protein [Mumia flava]PJJ57045.1 hypothetical protein CLV56_1265 [Mumia flava]